MYTVHIRRNADGIVREYIDDFLPWDEGSLYVWEEGNYSCDCNRELFFAEAAGEEHSDDLKCGSSRYTVVKIVLSDGTEVKTDESLRSI